MPEETKQTDPALAEVDRADLLAEIREGLKLANVGLSNAFCAAKKLGFADTCLEIAETKNDVSDAYVKIVDFIHSS